MEYSIKENKERLPKATKVALFITNAVGTVWCAVIFGIIALISLPYEIQGGPSAFITWLTQTFLQLVLMSIILVGQNIQTKHAEAKAERDLETDLAIKKELETLMARMDKMETEKLDKILNLLENK
jgi:uncharacterized membrane protein